MDAGKKSISDILNGNRVLEIPFFQRAYVWHEEQWERLLADMEEITATNELHFLGSVILKQQPTSTDSSVGDLRTVIDGQQRLTTLTIFFKVLHLKTNTNRSFERLFTLEDGSPVINHNHNDVDEFNRIVQLTELIDLEGSSRTTAAYQYFKEHINLDKLDINRIKNNVQFVGVDLHSHEDEQQIFDTINSLGVRLTTGELLKNYFFNRHAIDNYNKTWKEIFEKDADCKAYWEQEITTGRIKRNNLEMFFYSYLQIKIQEDGRVRAEDKIMFRKFEGLFHSYKKLIEKYELVKEDIIQEIREYATLYRDNFDPTTIERHLTNEAGIERINTIIFGLENTTIIPYVLYVLKSVQDTNERKRIFDYLEAYLLRRIVCRASGKNYNNLFSESLIINKANSYASLKSHIEDRHDLNYMPTDSHVVEAFKNSILTNKQAAGVLYMIESKIRNSLSSTALLGVKQYSLEHLMPKKWLTHWPRPESQEEISKYDNLLLTMGNLAIITCSLNSSIKNADWDTKKQGKASKKGLNHYANGLLTLNDALQETVWDDEKIEERAEFLANHALSIWKA